VFLLPLIDECLDTLTGNMWFSKLDANSAFHQIRISPKDRQKTAFITKYGLFEFVRMGFGLCNAPATFESDELSTERPHMEYRAGLFG
jgi:hypothetical protein